MISAISNDVKFWVVRSRILDVLEAWWAEISPQGALSRSIVTSISRNAF